MGFQPRILNYAFLVVANLMTSSCLQIWNGTSQLPSNMTMACKRVLMTNISCNALYSISDVTTRLPSNATDLGNHCSGNCNGSLESWAKSVRGACGNLTYPGDGGGSFNPATIASNFLWTQQTACLTDNTTHQFCGVLLNNTSAENKCSNCFLKYMAALLSSWQGSARVSSGDWTSLLDQCHANPSDYPTSPWIAPPVAAPTEARNITCFGGCYYQAQEEDTCDSIAEMYGVATDRFLYQNGMDWNCSQMATDRRMCVGSQCALYKVQENDTCGSILNEHGMTLTELLAWNPIIWQRDCSNIDALVGRTICISPPGTEEYNPVNLTVTWANSWVTPAGSWTAAATSGSAAPNSTVRTRLFPRTPFPTSTMVYNATMDALIEEYAAQCPVTEADFKNGFEWHHLSQECYEMLHPYCGARTSGPLPTSTTFPAECLPSTVMKRVNDGA
ncbi:carbohydrate-binding module family 50 protein [Hypomontagnella submonticulosa]|nr:carbohydrate-binding module family 50 protein [Hypomontagnella submonticulosa]